MIPDRDTLIRKSMNAIVSRIHGLHATPDSIPEEDRYAAQVLAEAAIDVTGGLIYGEGYRRGVHDQERGKAIPEGEFPPLLPNSAYPFGKVDYPGNDWRSDPTPAPTQLDRIEALLEQIADNTKPRTARATVINRNFAGIIRANA